MRMERVILIFIGFFHTSLNILFQTDNIRPDISLHCFIGKIGSQRPHQHLKTTFGKKFSQQIIDANLESVKRAYEEVQQ